MTHPAHETVEIDPSEVEVITAPPASGRRVSLAVQAAALLAVEAQIATLREQAEEQRRTLLARMEAEGAVDVIVRGAGTVKYIAGTTRSNVDGAALETLAREYAAQLGLEFSLPLKPTTVRASLRVSVNK